MSFNILDHLDELEDVKENGSWILAACPICSGKLKISNSEPKRGAYACYTEECHSINGVNKIREKLYKYKRTPFQQKTPFSKSQVFRSTSSLAQIVRPVHLSTTDIADYTTTCEYVSPVVIQTSTVEKLTVYAYDDFQVNRVDRQDEKFLFTSCYDEQGLEVQDVPSKLTSLPIYQNRYLQPNLFMVEGEKCADTLHKLGIACITVHVKFWQDSYLDKLFYMMHTQGLRNVMYLADNDIPGIAKASKVVKCLWLRGVGAKYINTSDLFSTSQYSAKSGFDIADAYDYNLINSKNYTKVLNFD